MNVPTRYQSYPSASGVLVEGRPGYPVAADTGTTTVRFHIDGLTCAAEATRLEHRLSGLTGILSVHVNPVNEIAYIAFEPGTRSPEQILANIEAEGFGGSGPH